MRSCDNNGEPLLHGGMRLGPRLAHTVHYARSMDRTSPMSRAHPYNQDNARIEEVRDNEGSSRFSAGHGLVGVEQGHCSGAGGRVRVCS